jgi:signal transduction histidine kinase
MAFRAEQITANNLSGRLTVEDEEDEVGRMGLVLNSLLLRLERSFTQLQRFTADAAHELRTPLTSIRAVGEGALEGDQSLDTYRNAVSSVLEETSRLSETVEGLLLISRAEAGEIPHHFSCFPLSELVSEIVFLLDLVIDERKIRIEQSSVLPEHTLVFADRTLLRTGVVNVLHNAIKFSPVAATIYITFASFELGGKQFVRLSIRDEGPGIAPADREKVFERFFRLRDASVAQQEGAGLGLAIASLVIEANHGRVFFDKNDVPGALCQIEVPAATPQTTE